MLLHKSKSFAGFTSSHGNLNSMNNAPVAESTEPVTVAYAANKNGGSGIGIGPYSHNNLKQDGESRTLNLHKQAASVEAYGAAGANIEASHGT